jgi:selenocysteine lyase/cysteine desulfurase
MQFNKIHFNNAGSSLPPDEVVETVIAYLREEAAVGGYEAEYKYREQLENTYASIARLINAEKDEIALVENASIAWTLAFKGIRSGSVDTSADRWFQYQPGESGGLQAERQCPAFRIV